MVVVPGIHDVYGDGSCGVMSLQAMDCRSPSTGGDFTKRMYWGEYGTKIPGLSDLDQVPTGNTSDGIPTGQSSRAYLPTDIFWRTQCAHDTDAYYLNSSYTPIPSPYLTDGSRNPGYYQTSSPSSTRNALADFDGIGNTAKIITQRGSKDYSSWRPSEHSPLDYPAASCCDMFYTEGTQQGDWYLPACGELGYIMPPFNKIDTAITNLVNAYGSSFGVKLPGGSYGHWSSSGNTMIMIVHTSDGYVCNGNKTVESCVRAFLRVGGSE